MRVSFNYFISEASFRYIVEAVRSGRRRTAGCCCREYRFDPAPGCGGTAAGLVEPPLRLAQVRYDGAGALTYPVHDERAPEEALADYLAQARRLFAARSDVEACDHEATGIGEEFERLRWFELPAACVEP